MKGKIIVIDGMDGCGKHTQANILYKELKKDNDKILLYSFPNYEDDSSYFVKKLLNGDYKDIISDPYLFSLFYAVDRSISYHKDIKDKYEKGYTIILDRYYISNMIYNLHLLKSHANKFYYIYYIKTVEVEGLKLPVPDITILLTANPEVSEKLLNKRYENDETKKDIFEDIDTQKEVLNNIDFLYYYKDLVSVKDAVGKLKVLFIHDDKGNIYTEEEMARKIISLV